ncbi:S-adenosyl-L-methionine-dependent methyltransferase [Hypoxylon sp. FL1284]|nr:S-adenosyl-L-methionine-dependent methyltransferase [Hypoxylon sp. FL1284]
MSQTATETSQEHGYSMSEGVNWTNYIAAGRTYPKSFFDRIYAYHAQDPRAAWSLAHDVGAGCGVVSATLADRFDTVAVSDPNEGYAELARKLLVEESKLPESRFRFLQETAEDTKSIAGGTADLITACECIHWTTPPNAIREFGRQLRPGGAALISYYTRPLIDGNEAAAQAWLDLWKAFSKISTGGLYDKAYYIANNGLDCLEFPADTWERVERVYINAKGTLESFAVNDKIGPDNVKPGERRVWVDDDPDWANMRGIDWFKAFHATWMPSISVSRLQEHWDRLEAALGGKEVKTRTPIAMVLATKKA